MEQEKLEALRKEAVKMYLENESPKVICKKLSVSESWLFKWIRRYKTGEKNWFKDKSRVPHTIHMKVSSQVEKKVIAAREILQQINFSQIGALNIQYQMQSLGEKQIPPAWTINRILKRNNLVNKREKKYQPKGNPYPQFPLIPLQINTLHQFDTIGPRYLKGDGCFYSHNLMDIASHRVAVNPKRSKHHQEVVISLWESWEKMGIPSFLQLDNQLPYRGSNRYPRSFGIVIKLYLLLGVEPIFVPLSEPWRNGYIEKFQDTFEHKFFRKIVFSDFKDLQLQAKCFETFHNQNHRYSYLKSKTPNQMLKNNKFTMRKLPRNFNWDRLKERPKTGYIHIIRFIRSNRVLDIFGEKFKVSKTLVYEYVRATIVVKEQKIKLFHQDNVIDEINYKLPG